MRVTNIFNLPLNPALMDFKKPNQDTLSVTRLIDSPLIQRLTVENWDNIEVDVSDMLYILEGQGMHAVLEGHAPANSLVEEGISYKYGGATEITARPDLYDIGTGIVTDWKSTSVWSYVKSKKRNKIGARDEWIKQLNVYAYILERNGFPVKGLQAWIWFRDWSVSEHSRYGADYPACKLMKVEIPMWPESERFNYIGDRIILHNQCRNAATISDCHCTPEDRWQEPDTYAVMKKGRKTALAVFGSKTRPGDINDAKNYMYSLESGKVEDYSVEVRKGGYLRCVSYCNVRFVCPIVKAEGITPIQSFGGTK